MKPKYIQIDCPETDSVHYQQAEAVLKYKPDIIILEYPADELTPDTIYNSFPPGKKPINLLQKQIESLEKAAKTDKWIKSDISMWRNIAKLWREGKQCLVYRCDAPHELVNKWHLVWGGMYPSAVHNWFWWVQIYLREKYMAQNIDWVLTHNNEILFPTILIFLQSFHWKHVKFLLKNPTKGQEWEYYFGKRFKKLTPKTIKESLKEENTVFYKYWEKISSFD